MKIRLYKKIKLQGGFQMKFVAKVTELRSYLVEVEAENTKKANDIVLAEIDKKNLPQTVNREERVIVEFNKSKGVWSKR